MQIFSELQRNSSNQIFVKLLLVYFINFFSSFTPFFPLMIGYFILCEEFLTGLLFVAVFSILHNMNFFYFFGVLLVGKFVLVKYFKNIIDFDYQDVFILLGVYILVCFYLFYFTNTNIYLLGVYMLYNYFFDLIVIRLLKCELRLF